MAAMCKAGYISPRLTAVIPPFARAVGGIDICWGVGGGEHGHLGVIIVTVFNFNGEGDDSDAQGAR